MDTHTAPRPDGYWLGDGPDEVEHLLAQAEVYAPEADELLDRVGLRPGASAIDLGCGVLGILPALSERVGAGGRVVGLDIEPRLLARAARPGLAVETVVADAARTGLPAATFDLVHERTLLLNLTDPEAAVAEMARIARPGGIVALQDPDVTGWVCDPPHPAFERLRTELMASFIRTGKDFTIGRRAARLLRDAGLEDVETRATARVTHPGDYYHTFILTLCRLLGAHAADPDQLAADAAAVREHLSRPDTITCQPLLWQAWGVRP
jgi:SAM-dependent methyltransferase